MAKAGYMLVSVLLLLGTFAQSGLGRSILANQVGSIHMLNDGHYDMSIQTTIHYVDGTSTTDPAYSPLPEGEAFIFQVLDNMDCVTTSFKMTTPAGLYTQTVKDWCAEAGQIAIDCVPDCFWLVDITGFSDASSGTAQQSYVTGWNGPSQAD